MVNEEQMAIIGQTVEHATFGRGELLAMFDGGRRWYVRFEQGNVCLLLPRQAFLRDKTNIVPEVKPRAETFVRPELTVRTQFEARQLIEVLRLGLPPIQFVREMTIGIEKERVSLIAALNQTSQKGGAGRVLFGEYGFGKSHLVEWTAQEALTRGFLVARTSLDLIELPPHRPFGIYSHLMRNIRYPDTETRGITPLLEKAARQPHVMARYHALTKVKWDPIAMTLDVFQHVGSSLQHKTWATWLEGGPRATRMKAVVPPQVKFPTLYKSGKNMRQLAYLLGGLSALAQLVSYSGLCVLIDEAESYSLLQREQRPKATLFFQSMIYTALGCHQPYIQPDILPQHRHRDYPAAFGEQQALFFLFAVTQSENNLPLEQWLNDSQLLYLTPHYNPRQLSTFLHQVLTYHAQAYHYTPDTRHHQIRRAAAEHLAWGMRYKHISIRGLVRLAVELFDLLYLHPDFDVVKLLSELRKQMRGT